LVSLGPLEAPRASAREVELNSVLEWVNMAMDGEPVSDFALSFPIVARAQELFAATQRGGIGFYDYEYEGEYATAKVTLTSGEVGTGTSRKRHKALSYALEDLARAVKEKP
jgi:hypothetical protein